MKKNWLVLMLVIALATTLLVGCKDKKDDVDATKASEETDATEETKETDEKEETEETEETEPAAPEGKVLRIYCWNEEFQDRFNAYYGEDKLPEGVEVEWVITLMKTMHIKTS